MINNRQGGRRRGRGGGGGRQQGSAPGPGNRQENRNRGNAAQLLEKYKSMARDAQMAGDRVQTEYFLQYADHYYRVLNENRARFEEQRRQHDDYDDEGEEEAVNAEAGEDERDARQRHADRGGRFDRDARFDRDSRSDREPPPEREARPERGEPDARNGDGRRPRGRRERYEVQDGDEERIALDVLPPAISAAPGSADTDEEPPKAPRRRARRTRDDGDEIAPAA